MIEKVARTPPVRVGESSDSVEISRDDMMEDNFHSPELDAGVTSLDVRLRNPPDKSPLGTVVPESQIQVADMQVENAELQGLNDEDLVMGQSQPRENCLGTPNIL